MRQFYEFVGPLIWEKVGHTWGFMRTYHFPTQRMRADNFSGRARRRNKEVPILKGMKANERESGEANETIGGSGLHTHTYYSR